VEQQVNTTHTTKQETSLSMI